MLGDQPSAVSDPDVVQVRGDVDAGADDGGVDGVVAVVDTDVVGGKGSIAAVSAVSRSTGLAFRVRTTRVFAVTSQSVNWVLKSAGDSKCRPGMNEVSKNR